MLIGVVVFALFLIGIVSMASEAARGRRRGSQRSWDAGGDALWMHPQGGLMHQGQPPLHDDGCLNIGGLHHHGDQHDQGQHHDHGGHFDAGGHHDAGAFDGGGGSFDGGGFDGGGASFDGGGGGGDGG